MAFPKVIYDSAGARKALYLHWQPMRHSARRKEFIRHDEVSTAGVQQSRLERIEDLLRLELEFVDEDRQWLAFTEEPENAIWTKDADLVVGKNYLIRSEEFDNAAWDKVSVGVAVPIVTPNAVAAPDGTLTADQIDFPATGPTDDSIIRQFFESNLPALAGQKLIFPVYLRADSPVDMTLLLLDDIGNSNKLVNLTTNWQRFDVARTVPGGATVIQARIATRTNQAAKTIFAWGAQAQYGAAASDYTATAASPVELKIADPFWEAAPSGVTGGDLGFNSALPKRGRQWVALVGINAMRQNVAAAVAGLNLTGSVYGKQQAAGGPGLIIELLTSDFVLVQSGTLGLTASWQRLSVPAAFTKAMPGTAIIRAKSTAAGSFYVFGPQLDRGPVAKDYVRGGDIPRGLMTKWADFFAEAGAGKPFEYYPDSDDGSGFDTWKLISTNWPPDWEHQRSYAFELLARKVP